VIATANIGCMTHLQTGASVPVRHWVELVDAALHGADRKANRDPMPQRDRATVG
jgi:glycolate oxidase iron-sulfur subunit